MLASRSFDGLAIWLLNLLMVVAAIISITMTIPKTQRSDGAVSLDADAAANDLAAVRRS